MFLFVTCMPACVQACVRACVRASMRACVRVFAFMYRICAYILYNYTGMFPVGDTSCRTLIDVCVCVCVCVSVCPPTYR